MHFTLSTLRLNRVGKKWMQIFAGRWVRAFDFRREDMSCFSEGWRFLYLRHGPQKLPGCATRIVACPVFFFCCGYGRISACRWIPCTDQWISLHDRFSPGLICFGDELGAGRRVCELLQMGVAAFASCLGLTTSCRTTQRRL